MPEKRLSTLDKDFYTSLLREDDPALRRAALAAARYAVEKTKMHYPAVEAVLKLLHKGHPLPETEVRELGKLVINLDNIQVDLRERVKLGKKTEAEWRIAFVQARVANAVFQAANVDPLNAALESIYEAYSATEDWPALVAFIDAAIRSSKFNLI
jgi:hypothetical protein